MDTRKQVAMAMLSAIGMLAILRQFVAIGDWEVFLWLALMAPALLLPHKLPQTTIRTREMIIVYTLAFAGIYLVVWWLTGVLDDYGVSPYLRTPTGLLYNVFTFGGVMVAQEVLRAFVSGSDGRGKRRLAVLMGLVLFLNDFRYQAAATALSQASTAIPYVGGTLVPDMIKSILLTWMAWNAGPIPGLVWRLLPELAQWILPTLPKAEWLMRMLLGIVVPLFTLLALQQVATPRPNQKKRGKRQKARTSARPVTWVLFVALLSSMFAFTLGVLPYKPMVIATNSMLPAIRAGDVVILHDADTDTLEAGDIAAYRLEGYNIVHRVLSVVLSGDDRRFLFQGDNNGSPDAFEVESEQIFGEVVYVIPYLGSLSLAIKTMESPENAPVETGA